MVDEGQPRLFRVREGRRLAYYGQRPDAGYWDSVWDARLEEGSYRASAGGVLDESVRLMLPYLPRKGRILEAGCGRSQVVLSLRARGYDCEGVEQSAETVERVKGILPDLPISHGDVTDLPVPDAHYRAYISIGVIEHRKAGPEPFLSEARRVLEPGGVAAISVPCFNALRQAKCRFGLYPGPRPGMDFYQYAYSVPEMTSILDDHGFGILATRYYGLDYGLRTECPLYNWLRGRRYVGGALRRAAGRLGRICRPAAHMALFICRSNSQGDT